MNGTAPRTSGKAYAFYYVLLHALWAGAIACCPHLFNTTAVIAAILAMNSIFMYSMSVALSNEICLVQQLRREFAQKSSKHPQQPPPYGIANSASAFNLSQTPQPVITQCCCGAHRRHFGAITNSKSSENTTAAPSTSTHAAYHFDCHSRQTSPQNFYPTPKGAAPAHRAGAVHRDNDEFLKTSECGEHEDEDEEKGEEEVDEYQDEGQRKQGEREEEETLQEQPLRRIVHTLRRAERIKQYGPEKAQ
jgi:hypothetical protein